MPEILRKIVKVMLSVIPLVLTALYPIWAWWGLRHYGIVPVAAVLAAAALLRALIRRDTMSLGAAALAAAISLTAWLSQAELALTLYPVAMNVLFFSLFFLSLKHTPIIERIARLKEPELPAQGVLWCRKVTLAWCVFFVFNGLCALLTVIIGDHNLWALYNGGIAYGLMGLMFIGEWLLRRRALKREQAQS